MKQLTPRGKQVIVIVFLGGLFAVLAVLFGIYDLRISQAFFNSEAWLGSSLEVMGQVIAPFLAVLAGLVIAFYFGRQRQKAHARFKLFCGIFAVAGGAGYCAYLYGKLSLPSALIAAAASLLCFAAWAFYLYKMRKKGPDELRELLYIAVVAVCLIAAVLTSVTIIKAFWGRVRFRDMQDMQAAAEFSRWFLPQGLTGNASFPSGHTAHAATLWVITLFAPRCRRLWGKVLCYAVPSLVILLMAISRVQAGAHYASDVLVGGTLAIALFYVVRHIVSKRMGCTDKDI